MEKEGSNAYSPSSCGKSDEKPSLIHTRPSRRDGYRLFRLSAGVPGKEGTWCSDSRITRLLSQSFFFLFSLSQSFLFAFSLTNWWWKVVREREGERKEGKEG
tara:strand:+ start:93 stop:398 length:306 start_codon:yes stop_codon:yes gene_type:complete